MAFLCIMICIKQCYCLSISYQPQSTWSEWRMILSNPHSCAVGWQSTACRSFNQVLIHIAQLPQLSSSSSFFSSLISFLLSHMTVTSKTISSVLVVLQSVMESKHSGWFKQPLQMHQWIIGSHNLVPEIKKMVTPSEIGTRIAFQWAIRPNNSIYLLVAPAVQVPLPFLRPNMTSIA